jgi:amidase
VRLRRADAAFLTGGAGALFSSSGSATAFAADPPWVEASIAQLQAMMSSGALTSKELTRGYLKRIADLNPLLHAVIETNPNAESTAARLDAERRSGLRGPLHGIPVLVKDNIATDDQMQTTAGSLALVNSKVPGDSPLVAKLRAAGAVILGKANLGEWANFRGFFPFEEIDLNGWSARGGVPHNPYALDYTVAGSSSGPAIAAATNMCAAAVGSETDGSITVPCNFSLIVGLKPTLGLISQQGIIPISHMQDTAGPMCRSVSDVAVMLGVMRSPTGAVAGQTLPVNYTQFLHRGALNGARIGVDTRFSDDYSYFGFPGDGDTMPFFNNAVAVMQSLGATIVPVDTGDVFLYTGDEFLSLLFEFKQDIAAYLSTLGHTRMRTLADLIAFNVANCPAEMTYFGQELFEISDSTTDLTDPAYLAARANASLLAKSGIDNAIATHHLDAIVAPHVTNTAGPAVSGYPNLALPTGIRANGRPAGLLMYSGFLQEPKLIALGYDLEQELNVRRQPRLLGNASPLVDAGICASLPKKPHTFTGKAHLPHGRIFV